MKVVSTSSRILTSLGADRRINFDTAPAYASLKISN
jgi:hypothetical protein